VGLIWAAPRIRGAIGRISGGDGEEVNVTDKTHIVYFAVQEKRTRNQRVIPRERKHGRMRNS
jgi:hypothetical protein